MPIFEYKCENCGREFELLVKPSAIAECPECQSPRLQKQISSFAPGISSGDDAYTPDVPTCQTCGIPGGPCATN